MVRHRNLVVLGVRKASICGDCDLVAVRGFESC